MNEKETGEIRRRTKLERSNITKFYGRFVSGEGKTISDFCISVASMTESEAKSFFSHIHKILDGKPEMNRINLKFTPALVEESESHQLLRDLVKTSLDDESIRESFYDKIVGSLSLKGNYLILAASDTYDVKKKGRSITSDSDDDDEKAVYRYILCAICPVKESKMVLEYKEKTKDFRGSDIVQLLKAPVLGFLYPAFDDRRSNIYGSMLFTNDLDENWGLFLRNIFDVAPIIAPKAQKAALGKITYEALGDECTMNVVQAMMDSVEDRIAFAKETKDENPPSIDIDDIMTVLEREGVSEEKREAFESTYNETFGEGSRIPAQNICDNQTYKLDIGDSDVIVRTKKKLRDTILIEDHNGEPSLIIRLTDIPTINGKFPINVPGLEEKIVAATLARLFGEGFGEDAESEADDNQNEYAEE